MAYELFVDSFDTWTTSNTSRWQTLSNSIPVASSGRRSSAALRQQIGSTTTATAATSIPASTHCVIGFAYNMTRPIGTLATYLIYLKSGTTNLITLTVTADNRLSVTLGGTTYLSTKTYSPGTWVYIEIGAHISDSGSFEVKVNGSSDGWISLGTVDTKPSTETTITSIHLVASTAGLASTSITAYIDDLYITYGNELKWLGDIRVDALALTADSTPQDWTSDTGNAWDRLNNTSAGYITGTTLDDESLFALADYTPATTAIHGAQVCAYARKTDAGSRSMAIEAKSDTTTDVGDTIALGDTTTEYRQVWLTDPDTAAAWTDGGLDALEIGVKVMD